MTLASRHNVTAGESCDGSTVADVCCGTGSNSVVSRLSFHPPQRGPFLTRSIALSIDAAISSSACSVAQELATSGNPIRPLGQKLSRRARSRRGSLRVDLNEFLYLEIDKISRAARIEAGAFGPALEAQLKPHGLTLRHFPQSFECSTLGGWIATRSGGHFATLYTHIDDLVESVRVITPKGIIETRRLPGSGAGPSPDRLLIGSEGILGIITQAWMRLQDRPKFRAGGAVQFPDFFAAARALRAISQAGVYPANCRILDPEEAFNTGAADGSVAIMVLAFESGDHPVEPWMKRAHQCCVDYGATPERISSAGAHREGAAGAWRNAFVRMSFARERTIQRGIINDTFETTITWERFESFHDRVKAATERAIVEATGRAGQVTCRCTHVYPDGPAPYFTFHAAGRHSELSAQWHTIKSAD